MDLVTEISPVVGPTAACEALCVARATYYRRRQSPAAPRPAAPRPPPHRALPPKEVEQVLDVLRSMYRYLAAAGQAQERRNQLVHPRYAKPELLATAPNQVWSWELTKLRAAQKWTYFYLYVLLDIYSRYVVGWMLAHRESGEVAARLVEETCAKQGIERGQLTVHADRGSAPKSQTLAQMFTDLGVEASHSRPRVSNDNPFSEAQFKTYNYQPEYPNRFGSHEHALSYSRSFFDWNCHRHRHSGIAMLTPADVHYGHAADVLAERERVLDAAFEAHPERFARGRPTVPALPRAVWINPPEDKTRTEIELQ